MPQLQDIIVLQLLNRSHFRDSKSIVGSVHNVPQIITRDVIGKQPNYLESKVLSNKGIGI